MTEFNEAEYLALYPDVAAAIKAGAFKSGHEHYLKPGKYKILNEGNTLFGDLECGINLVPEVFFIGKLKEISEMAR